MLVVLLVYTLQIFMYILTGFRGVLCIFLGFHNKFWTYFEKKAVFFKKMFLLKIVHDTQTTILLRMMNNNKTNRINSILFLNDNRSKIILGFEDLLLEMDRRRIQCKFHFEYVNVNSFKVDGGELLNFSNCSLKIQIFTRIKMRLTPRETLCSAFWVRIYWVIAYL